MSAIEFSHRVEILIQKIKGELYQGSDEILLNPYQEIVSSLEYRVPQDKLDKFKMYYQAEEGKSVQELIDENYDMEQLLKDLQELLENH